MVKPCKGLQNSIRIIQQVFRLSGEKYWLSFGGLFGIVMRDGIIPDSDLDICTYYGANWQRIKKTFERCGYRFIKALRSDTDPEQVLYCSFEDNHSGFGGDKDNHMPHICLSFWYPHGDKYYYCHDQCFEVKSGIDVPKSGYFFRGVPKDLADRPEYFREVEWPGINGQYKVSVPRFPGAMLDYLYPDWAYLQQRYNVGRDHKIDLSRCDSVYHGGAVGRYAVHVKSMADWKNAAHVEAELKKSEKKYWLRLKELANG
jgi:hypothetical protein